MERRASRTAYYLNRRLGYLALVATRVRFPDSVGVWVPVADPEREPWKVVELLGLAFPGEIGTRFPFIALLTDHDVEEFENELRGRGLLAADDTG
jgi:hypothetical protein